MAVPAAQTPQLLPVDLLGARPLTHWPPAVDPLNRWQDAALAGFTCGWLALGGLTVFRRVRRAPATVDGNPLLRYLIDLYRGAQRAGRDQMGWGDNPEAVGKIHGLCSGFLAFKGGRYCAAHSILSALVSTSATTSTAVQQRQMRVPLLVAAVACAVGTAVVAGVVQPPQLLGQRSASAKLGLQSPTVEPLNRWPDAAAAGFTCGLLALGALTMFRRVQSYRRQLQRSDMSRLSPAEPRALSQQGRRWHGRDEPKASRRRELTKHHEEMRHRARERKLEIERLQKERSKRRSASGGSSAGEINQTSDHLTSYRAA